MLILVNPKSKAYYNYNKLKLTAIPKQMLSFKQLIEQNAHQAQQCSNLFTKLKQNHQAKINATSESIATNVNQQYGDGTGMYLSAAVIVDGDQFDISTILKECQVQLQAIKLEKANQVANLCIVNQLSVKEIINEIQYKLDAEIYQVVSKKCMELSKSKHKAHLQSTLVDTFNRNSNKRHSQSLKNSAAKTPRIVQFTLGNQKSSSSVSKSNSQSKVPNTNRGESQEVSEFFVSSKGAASKSIREKVMGQRKLK